MPTVDDNDTKKETFAQSEKCVSSRNLMRMFDTTIITRTTTSITKETIYIYILILISFLMIFLVTLNVPIAVHFFFLVFFVFKSIL